MNKIKLLEATQGKPVWVLRQNAFELEEHNAYLVFATKCDLKMQRELALFYSEDFETVYGLKLNPGEYTRIRFGVSPV